MGLPSPAPHPFPAFAAPAAKPHRHEYRVDPMRPIALLAAAALLIALPAGAATYRLGSLEAADPWSRPAAAKMNGAGFMTLTNRGKVADRLTAVESPGARKIEIHRSLMTNGVASMQRQDQGVPLAPGQTVTFGPGGYHVMLIGLAKTQKGGDKLPATLVFQSGTRMKVEFEVRSAPPATAAKSEHQHH
jgi:periplasmic copper chaperone A